MDYAIVGGKIVFHFLCQKFQNYSILGTFCQKDCAMRQSCKLGHPVTHRLTHSLKHRLTLSLKHRLTHRWTHSVKHRLPHTGWHTVWHPAWHTAWNLVEISRYFFTFIPHIGYETKNKQKYFDMFTLIPGRNIPSVLFLLHISCILVSVPTIKLPF